MKNGIKPGGDLLLPRHGAQSRIVELINGAQQSVHFLAFVSTSGPTVAFASVTGL